MKHPRSVTAFTLAISTAILTAASALAFAQPALAATDRTAPSIPQGLRVTGSTDSSVSLAWSASSDASGRVTYQVLVNGSQQNDATETAHTRGGLAADTSYSFSVRAVDRYGNVSRAGNSLTASTARGGGGTTETPVNLRVTGVDYDSIDLAWDAPEGAPIIYYLIYSNGLWVNSSYGTTGSIDYLGAGTTHAIEVRARRADNYGLSAPASTTATTRADAGPPTTPANLRIQTDAVGRPTGLAWDTSTDDRGVSNYWLTADGNPAFSGGPGVSFSSLTDQFCTVLRGRTYTFTVRARDLSGNLSSTGTALTVTIP